MILAIVTELLKCVFLEVHISELNEIFTVSSIASKCTTFMLTNLFNSKIVACNYENSNSRCKCLNLNKSIKESENIVI